MPKFVTMKRHLFFLAAPADPYEENNLAKTEPERTKTMTAQLTLWMDSVVRSANGEDFPDPF